MVGSNNGPPDQVVCLAAGQEEAGRVAQRVDQGVDLGVSLLRKSLILARIFGRRRYAGGQAPQADRSLCGGCPAAPASRSCAAQAGRACPRRCRPAGGYRCAGRPTSAATSRRCSTKWPGLTSAVTPPSLRTTAPLAARRRSQHRTLPRQASGASSLPPAGLLVIGARATSMRQVFHFAMPRLYWLSERGQSGRANLSLVQFSIEALLREQSRTQTGEQADGQPDPSPSLSRDCSGPSHIQTLLEQCGVKVRPRQRAAAAAEKGSFTRTSDGGYRFPVTYLLDTVSNNV